MQLSGEILRQWLVSARADPTSLLGLTLEHLDEDRGGRITEVSDSTITITDLGKPLRIPFAALPRWVLQDVPQGLGRRIRAVLAVAPAQMEELEHLGFDAETLAAEDASLVLAMEEALTTGGDVPFDAIIRLAALAMLPAQARAAQALLRRCLDHPSRASAHARLQLARLASQAGNRAAVIRLTDPALQGRADPRITSNLRAMLLTVRAACIAQLAQTCGDLVEAKRLAGMALAVGGRSEHLSNTFFLIHRRAESLGCKLTAAGA